MGWALLRVFYWPSILISAVALSVRQGAMVLYRSGGSPCHKSCTQRERRVVSEDVNSCPCGDRRWLGF
jgi:hypothetical protein